MTQKNYLTKVSTHRVKKNKFNSMRKYILGGLGITLITFSLFSLGWKSPIEKKVRKRTPTEQSIYDHYVSDLYDSLHVEDSGLRMEVFERALTGFYNLKNAGKLSGTKSVISVADMDMLSSSKRLWIIDLDQKKVILNTWVAHGQHSGADKATQFSNVNDSYQSSIGFYVTGEIYTGKHGKSLRLDGMDAGFNDNARSRSIVVHGASYVGQGTINALGRLGRSQGCPAVAQELANTVIDTIEGKTVLFINSSAKQYTSRFLDEHVAADFAQLKVLTPLPPVTVTIPES